MDLTSCSARVIDKSTGDVVDYILKIDTCAPLIFQNIILWLVTFAGIVAVVMIIFAGIKFITSGGDPKQTEGARKTLTYSILGLLLVILSFAILRFIAEITGVKCIEKFGFTQCKNACKVKSDCPPRHYCSSKKLCEYIVI